MNADYKTDAVTLHISDSHRVIEYFSVLTGEDVDIHLHASTTPRFKFSMWNTPRPPVYPCSLTYFLRTPRLAFPSVWGEKVLASLETPGHAAGLTGDPPDVPTDEGSDGLGALPLWVHC